MSNWTHVAAIARIDCFPEDKINFEKVFGRECRSDASDNVWEEVEKHPELFLPMGSEGGLAMSVWETPESGLLARYAVSIFGDLRDHDNAKEIVEWFKEKLSGLMVRQAIITVENEQNGTVNWMYDR